MKNLVDINNTLLFEKIASLKAKVKISFPSQQKFHERANQLERENHYLKQEYMDLEYKLATIEDPTKRIRPWAEGG